MNNGIGENGKQRRQGLALDPVLPHIGGRSGPGSPIRISQASSIAKAPEEAEIKILSAGAAHDSATHDQITRHTIASSDLKVTSKIKHLKPKKDNLISVEVVRPRGRNPTDLSSRTKFNSQDEIQYKFHENFKIRNGVSGANSRFRPLGMQLNHQRPERIRDHHATVAPAELPSANVSSLHQHASTKKNSAGSFSNEMIKETFVENMKSAEVSITDNTNHQTRSPKSYLSEAKPVHGNHAYSIVSAA